MRKIRVMRQLPKPLVWFKKRELIEMSPSSWNQRYLQKLIKLFRCFQSINTYYGSYGRLDTVLIN
jgi:hypothetical protein